MTTTSKQCQGKCHTAVCMHHLTEIKSLSGPKAISTLLMSCQDATKLKQPSAVIKQKSYRIHVEEIHFLHFW